MEQSEKTLDMIVNLCKNRGYVFPGSEIYGGLANSWDYGPLGVEFKNNVKKAWLKKFVQESPYNVGLDAAIIMNPQTWITTGHVAGFSDPLLDCRACKARHRADKLIGDEHPEVNVDAMSFDEMDAFIAEHEDIVCPVCGKHDFTPIRKFNLMFKTAIGVTEDSSSTCYLRPETAQASSSTLPTSSAPPAASCPSASARWARHSATRSPRATSPSVPVSSSRWSASSSASPAPTSSGSPTGRTIARTGC